MLRREFLKSGAAALGVAGLAKTPGERLAAAARAQVGVTTGYDPKYVRIPYPGGDVPRTTGVCADVIVRAGRDGLGVDLQRLVHEDMARAFGEYPKTWGMVKADSNIDHRRVMNLEAYWRRDKVQVWAAKGAVAGNGFGEKLEVGDILTWRLDGRLPHVGIVVADSLFRTRVVHNWGNGAEESSLVTFAPHRAVGQYRWLGA